MPPATVLGNVPPSENPPSTAQPSAMMPNIPSGPPRAGAAYSDHAAVVQGPTPTVPAHATTTEEITKAPLVPVTDSQNVSTEHTLRPAGPTVGPTGVPAASTAGNVPTGASAPAKSAVGDKPPASVWSTNGPKDPAPPKPATSLPNVPSDAKPPAGPAAADKPAGGAPAPAPGAGGPPPPSSLGNMPTGPAAGAPAPGGASGAPASSVAPASGAPATAPAAASTAPASEKPKLGVHWDKHLHDKEAKGPDPIVLKK